MKLKEKKKTDAIDIYEQLVLVYATVLAIVNDRKEDVAQLRAKYEQTASVQNNVLFWLNFKKIEMYSNPDDKKMKAMVKEFENKDILFGKYLVIGAMDVQSLKLCIYNQ